MNSNPSTSIASAAPVIPNSTPALMEPIHGDYSYIIKSLARSMCEKFGDVANSISYSDPMVELIILMMLLVIGIIIIVNYMY